MSGIDLSEIGRVAVVGASRDRRKYGYKVLMDLAGAGFEAYGINPTCGEIEGVPCLPDLSSLPRVPDLVITVVPPRVTEKLVREAAEIGVTRIWMQPGSESPEALAACEAAGIACVHDACIMVFRRKGILDAGGEGPRQAE